MFTTQNENGENVLVLKNAVECIGEPVQRWSVSQSATGTNTVTGDAVDQLAQYERMENMGKLIVLPCAVKDTVWLNTTPMNITGEIEDYGKSRKTYECYVRAFSVFERYVRVDLVCKSPKTNVACHITLSDFGETVFLTQSEAESALQEMKEMEG